MCMDSQLYIPLCLYFNGSTPSSWPPSSRLYIPLCLYFNTLLIQSFLLYYLLYIPLCLYFSEERDLRYKVSSLFTFHYVSILILYVPGLRYSFLSFTFHYVSILMPQLRRWCHKCCLLYIPLCLYFNEKQFCEILLKLYFTFHYVSILISSIHYSYHIGNNFTFHYVSILMIPQH